jgi:hypothetical protein
MEAVECPHCRHRLGFAEAVTMCTAHNPERNPRAVQRAMAEAAADPDPIDVICPRCFAMAAARIPVCAPMRCDHCLEDYEACRHVGGVKDGLLDRINVFSWLSEEKCPQCRARGENLGRTQGGATVLPGWRLAFPFAWFFRCRACRITWHWTGLHI